MDEINDFRRFQTTTLLFNVFPHKFFSAQSQLVPFPIQFSLPSIMVEQQQSNTSSGHSKGFFLRLPTDYLIELATGYGIRYYYCRWKMPSQFAATQSNECAKDDYVISCAMFHIKRRNYDKRFRTQKVAQID